MLFQGCRTVSLIKRGYVNPADSYEKVKFETIKTVIILPMVLNDISKNFIFYTGGQISTVQRDSLIGSVSNWGGASKRCIKLGSEILNSLKPGKMEFVDTYTGNTDFTGLKEQIPTFGGLIGQSVISKANWLIDYPNKILEVSNKELADSSFDTIIIYRKGGSPYTLITIDQEEYEVIIDFGSSIPLNVPTDSELAKALLRSYSLANRQKEKYTLGGKENFTKKVGVLPLVKLGGIEFDNVPVNINITSEPRVGISFFKNYLIYIDNLNDTYRVKEQDLNN